MNKRIDAISGLAGFAALMVIYAHLGADGFLQLDHHLHNVGIMIFFSLSGFLLAYLYIEKNFCAEEVAAYGLARFTRIAPAYLFAILAAFVIHSFIDPDFVYKISTQNLLRHLLFIGNESVFWTIGPQVQFYFLFIGIWATAAYFKTSRDPLPFVFLVFIGLFLIMIRREFPGTIIVSNLHFFVFGMLAGVARRKMSTDFRSPQMMTLVHASLLVIFLAVELGFVQLSLSMRTDNLNEIVLAMLIAFFVFAFSFPSWIERILFENPLMTLLGKYSFSLYLLHMPVLYWSKKLFPHDFSRPVYVFGTFVAIVAVAGLHYVTVERYGNQFVKAWGKKHSGVIERCLLSLGIKAKLSTE